MTLIYAQTSIYEHHRLASVSAVLSIFILMARSSVIYIKVLLGFTN
jgi:hypothetical protein